jgi:hypothetical protein
MIAKSTTKTLSAAIGLLLVLGVACGTPSSRTFPEGGYSSVRGDFLAFFERYGGEAVFGYPVSPEIVVDGVRVQYFQNTRMEYRPDRPPGERVVLSPLGLAFRTPDPPMPAPALDASTRYFAETGHAVSNAFLAFYLEHGGPQVLGQPITEALFEDERVVQHFENVRLVWVDGAPPDQQVQLFPLGLVALQQDPVASRLALGEGGQASINLDALLGTPVPADERVFPNGKRVSGDFLTFYEAHGGAAVFGQPLNDAYQDEDGRITQVLTNVQMVMEDGQVRLAPLGLGAMADLPPEQTAPVERPDDVGPAVRYVASTGHTIRYDFLDFYGEHGGEEVFGLPRTEFLLMPEGRLVQYFDNARFEWYSDAPDGQKVRLGPLGQALLEGGSGEQAQVESLTLTLWAAETAVAVGQTQTLNALVTDQNGNPISDAEAQITIQTSEGVAELEMPATDTHGMTSLEYEPTGEAGQFVYYTVSIHWRDLSATSQDYFLVWN